MNIVIEVDRGVEATISKEIDPVLYCEGDTVPDDMFSVSFGLDVQLKCTRDVLRSLRDEINAALEAEINEALE